MRLSRVRAKAHQEAAALLTRPRLTEDERCFVLENWRAGAHHMNNLAGAFFTPTGLARDIAVEIGQGSLLDLCAGIGTLAFHARRFSRDERQRIVCVEINPDYVAVGKKIIPEATWYCCDVLRLPYLGRFDWAVSNSPYGSMPRTSRAPRYRGRRFELSVIDVSSDHAENGVFLVPQQLTPFRYSGRSGFTEVPVGDVPDYSELRDCTGIEFEMNCGLDTSQYLDDWDDVVPPPLEIILADLRAARRRRAVGTTLELFDSEESRRQLAL